MSVDIFTSQKVGEMMRFCAAGYKDWGQIIKDDTASNFPAGHNRSAIGEVYWDDFNNEVTCILAIHTFLDQYLSDKRPSLEYKSLMQQRDKFSLAAVEYKSRCSTKNLIKDVDAKIDKNESLKSDRVGDLKTGVRSLGTSVNGVASKINGVIASLGALKSLRKNYNTSKDTWPEQYKTTRRDFLALASNIAGIFAPTALGNSIVVLWMIQDTQDLIKFEKTAVELNRDKQKLLKAADEFSGDTQLGDFFTYVLVTALAEYYGFAPNNGIRYNPQHDSFNSAIGKIGGNGF